LRFKKGYGNVLCHYSSRESTARLCWFSTLPLLICPLHVTKVLALSRSNWFHAYISFPVFPLRNSLYSTSVDSTRQYI
jgi:hypothetical protein